MSYVTRKEAGLMSPRHRTPLPTQPATHVFIHHTVSAYPTRESGAIGAWRGIQRDHMTNRGWSDIAYSYGVWEDVRLAGRTWDWQSGGTGSPHDRFSYSIASIANHERDAAPDTLIESIAKQIHNGIERGKLVATPKILGDRDVNATACPGAFLYRRLPDIRAAVADLQAGTEPPPPIVITLEDRVESLEARVAKLEADQ